VYQYLSLFENQTVAENIFVNKFPKNRFGFIDFNKRDIETTRLLSSLHIGHLIKPSTMVSALSAGEKQMVEIAKALSKHPRILILDEPTASITDTETQHLFEIIKTLKKQGTSVIYISHRLEELFRISDRITILKDGRSVQSIPTHSIQKETLITLMVGRKLTENKNQTAESGVIALEVRSLCNSRLKNISFTLQKGEILALTGLVGAGLTEIGKVIFGAMPVTKGQIYINGKESIIKNPTQALKHKIAYIPEDRKNLGIFSEKSISENIGSIKLAFHAPVFYDEKNTIRVSNYFIDKLKIACKSVQQKIATLSGGNQQKVVLSKWLSGNPEILILDEPTHGIDVGAKFEIYAHIQKLAKEGKSILLISSDLQEILAISNRVLVIKNGQITKELLTKNTTEEEILNWAM
jgi:ABC-type sugar transport system ATPase subunit